MNCNCASSSEGGSRATTKCKCSPQSVSEGFPISSSSSTSSTSSSGSNSSSSSSSSGQSTSSKSKKPMCLMLISSALNLRRGRSLNSSSSSSASSSSKRAKKLGRHHQHYHSQHQEAAGAEGGPAKKPAWWVMKLRGRCEDKEGKKCCACNSPAPTSSAAVAASVAGEDEQPERLEEAEGAAARAVAGELQEGLLRLDGGPLIDILVPVWDEDCDERARIQRAREMAEGVAPPASFRAPRRVQVVCPESSSVLRRLQLVCPPDLPMDSLRALFQTHVTLRACPLEFPISGCHTQVDYLHCLVPDLLDITNCSFYWGKIDRYEAERLLDGRPEGTFLLRDSAQEEFLFSVSFRKYARSLHARIEQWNHKFSFDSHDPGVFSSETVCGLIEHYKDPATCMFFEPMLTLPLHRNYPFCLQHLCRAVIASRLAYDDIAQLKLPKSLKVYLKEYHYRQKVRVECFDDDIQEASRDAPPAGIDAVTV